MAPPTRSSKPSQDADTGSQTRQSAPKRKSAEAASPAHPPQEASKTPQARKSVSKTKAAAIPQAPPPKTSTAKAATKSTAKVSPKAQAVPSPPTKAKQKRKGSPTAPAAAPPSKGVVLPPGPVPVFPAQQSGLDPIEYYSRLQQEEQRIRRILRNLLEVTHMRDAHDLGEAESDHGDIPLDSAAEVLEKERAYMMEEQLEDNLNRIQDARDKLQEGTYGICDNCRQPIAVNRLQVIPYAILCVRCQSKFE